jgi:SNF2 family DNA or RNA helicase
MYQYSVFLMNINNQLGSEKVSDFVFPSQAYNATPKLRRKLEGVNSMDILSLLKRLQQACNHPCLAKNCDDEQYRTIFERSYVSSKIKAIIDILNSVINQDAIIENDRTTKSCSSESAPVKALVFSQFTRMLDLLEPLLNTSHMQFRRLDGKMIRKWRHKAVNDFNMNPKVQS